MYKFKNKEAGSVKITGFGTSEPGGQEVRFAFVDSDGRATTITVKPGQLLEVDSYSVFIDGDPVAGVDAKYVE